MTVEKLKGKLFEVAWWFNLFCVFVAVVVVFSYHVQQIDPDFQAFFELLNQIEKDPFAVLRGGEALEPTDFVNIF